MSRCLNIKSHQHPSSPHPTQVAGIILLAVVSIGGKAGRGEGGWEGRRKGDAYTHHTEEVREKGEVSATHALREGRGAA
jgi:hypothetical protein